jgi:hypothetical protein
MHVPGRTLAAICFALTVPAAVVVACDLGSATSNPSELAKSATKAAAGCPDLSSPAAAAKVDWAAQFGIDASVGGKLKAGVVAALEIDGFAKKLDADLRAACGGLATDLGAGGQYKTGKEACDAAIKAMADIKGQMGGSVRIALDVQPPHCGVAIDAMANCLAECDAELEPGKVDVKCEPGKLSGSCEAECKGSCDIQGSAKCEGKCHGECSAKFSGSCGGECSGKCDGKKVDGVACEGRCEGKCSAGADGQCGGQCSGSCDIKGSAKCEGTCHGDCSVEMKAPKCEGEMTPPKASAECNASCETKLNAQVECTPPRIALRIDGAGNAQAAAKYKAAIEKNLPVVIKIAVGMKDQALSVAGNIKGVVDGVTAAVGQLKADPSVGARISACIAAPFQAAIAAAASVQANVDVSVNVQASASASAGGKASGKASGKAAGKAGTG